MSTTIPPAPVAATTADIASFDRVLAITGRVLIATIFILSGLSKLADPAGTTGYISSVGIPFPALALAGAVLVEVVGGVLLVAGYRLRVVALSIALFSLATAVLFHHNLADQNQFIHFFKNVAIAGGLFQIAAFAKRRA